MNRRRFLKGSILSAATLPLAGCADRLSRTDWAVNLLGYAERLSEVVQRAIAGDALAREYTEADISPVFRPNGSTDPSDPDYRALAANGFRDYRLRVGGAVEHPMTLSLEDIRGLPDRTQITRHDCVEGWSVIGKWRGARLGALLDRIGPRPNARYVVFHCADRLYGEDNYYESIAIADAYHPQTLLAYELNDESLPIANGAPVRLRCERQLGYKMAKYIMRIELVESLEGIQGGRGGFWEDRGYQWYAGI
ncbi:MAG TPA: molybdopterin-binding protein [Gammaproteobacteria bacterium]|nr:molybdopterin-binding protein [Gammaproteobacteria bacterium]